MGCHHSIRRLRAIMRCTLRLIILSQVCEILHCECTCADAKPAVLLPPLAAESIYRLPIKTDTLIVSQGERSVSIDFGDLPERGMVQKDRAKYVDSIVFRDTFKSIDMMCGGDLQFLKGHKVKWCCESMPGFVPPNAMNDIVYNTVSIFLFEKGMHDPADLIWKFLERDKKVSFVSVAGIKVAQRHIRYRRTQQPIYCWCPRECTLIMVKGEKSILEAVERWKDPRPSEAPLPWSMDAWRLINENSTTWAIRKAGTRDLERGAPSTLLRTLNPIRDPEIITLTWCLNPAKVVAPIKAAGSGEKKDEFYPFLMPPSVLTKKRPFIRPTDEPARLIVQRCLDEGGEEEEDFFEVFRAVYMAFGRGGLWGI